MRLCSGQTGPNTCWNLNECLIVKESSAGNDNTLLCTNTSTLDYCTLTHIAYYTHDRLHYKQVIIQ